MPQRTFPVLLTLCLPADESSPWRELFDAALPQATVRLREPDAPATPGTAQADYVIIAHSCASVFAEQPAPRAVFTVSAGVGHALRLPGLPADVPLIRVEDAGMAPQMVRYALAAVLRHALYLDRYAAQQRAGLWERHSPRARDAYAVGVLGLGVIGAAIARALVAQGIAVRGYANTRRDLDGVRAFAGADEFVAFLDGLDALVCVVPDTPATLGLLDRAALSRLAPGAHVVNIGRGSALVDADLIALLDEGRLGGATLDVFRPEPLPAEHPFWRRADVAVTPHVAGWTVPEDTVAQIAEKIGRLERGLPVTGVVDRERGY